ncbi:hypothetical protein LTS17_011330 [Exophiala oligosperma]
MFAASSPFETNTAMADHTRDKTTNVVGGVKSALRGIKGTGDVIRGTVNEGVDTAFDDKHGEVKNRAVKEKGEAEMKQADQTLGGGRPTTTGATGTGLKTGGLGRGTTSPTTATRGTTGTTTGTTTGAGAHSGGVGNLSSGVASQRGQGGEPGPTREMF